MKITEKPVSAVILAAGEGKRMKSDLAKVLHRVRGRPMVEYVVDAVKEAGIEHIIVVIGHQRERVRRALRGKGVEFAVQEDQRGTGHAVLQAESMLSDGDVVILCGDVPLLRACTIQKIIHQHRRLGTAATVLTAQLEKPGGYGRIVRDQRGFVDRIVEERDTTSEERGINEINTGTYCFDRKSLFRALREVKDDNRQGEYYLTDTISILREQGEPISAVVADDSGEVMGVNSPEELARAEAILMGKKNS